MSDEIMTPLVAAGVDVHGFPIGCCDEHPECSHMYYCVQVYDALADRWEADRVALFARAVRAEAALQMFAEWDWRGDNESLETMSRVVRDKAREFLAGQEGKP